MADRGTSGSSPQGLLQRAYRKLDPEIEAWLVDTGRFLLFFASLLIAYGLFKVLRALGVDRRYIDTLEWWITSRTVAFSFPLRSGLPGLPCKKAIKNG
jgi:hypothetical protein